MVEKVILALANKFGARVFTEKQLMKVIDKHASKEPVTLEELLADERFMVMRNNGYDSYRVTVRTR